MPKTVKIIAEVASNHGGDMELAKEMVRAASEAGADYFKVQSWQARTLRDREADPQYQWFIKAELSDEDHYELMEECRKNGIQFLTTYFDAGRASFLDRLGIKEIKIGSPDLSSRRMLLALKDNCEHIIISTGLALAEEVGEAAQLLSGVKLTLMHCVSMYPVPPEKVNLRRMDWLRQFTPSVGYSDHCVGIEAVKLAIARGANYVEKHFSLGEKRGCRYSPWDATPQELTEVVDFAESCQLMLGEGSNDHAEEVLQARERYIGRWGDNR